MLPVKVWRHQLGEEWENTPETALQIQSVQLQFCHWRFKGKSKAGGESFSRAFVWPGEGELRLYRKTFQCFKNSSFKMDTNCIFITS